MANGTAIAISQIISLIIIFSLFLIAILCQNLCHIADGIHCFGENRGLHTFLAAENPAQVIINQRMSRQWAVGDQLLATIVASLDHQRSSARWAYGVRQHKIFIINLINILYLFCPRQAVTPVTFDHSVCEAIVTE